MKLADCLRIIRTPRDFWGVLFCLAIAALVVTVNVFRFYALDRIPDGAQVDEIGSAVTLRCLATEGKTPRLDSPGLFVDLNFGSPKPPSYIYPAAAWTRIFGYSMGPVRAFNAFCILLTVVGLFFLVKMLFDFNCALIVAMLASISPWAWMFSRVAYESSLAVVYLVWGIYVLIRAKGVWGHALAAFLCSCAMYAYPPTRLQVPLLLLPFILYKKHERSTTLSATVTFVVLLVLLAVPIVMLFNSSEMQRRFQQVSIFSPEYLVSVDKPRNFFVFLETFIGNFIKHFDPQYLFVSGEKMLIHSTGRTGILSWLDAAGLFLAVWFFIKRAEHRPFIFLCIVGIVAGMVPAALTYEGIPHSLRSFGAWPFFMIISAYGLWQMVNIFRPAAVAVFIMGAFFALFFLRVYFVDYPSQSRGMFGFWSKQMAENAKTNEDWLKFMYFHRNQDYHFQYYLMNYRGESCSATRKQWQALRIYLGQPPN